MCVYVCLSKSALRFLCALTQCVSVSLWHTVRNGVIRVMGNVDTERERTLKLSILTSPFTRHYSYCLSFIYTMSLYLRSPCPKFWFYKTRTTWHNGNTSIVSNSLKYDPGQPVPSLVSTCMNKCRHLAGKGTPVVEIWRKVAGVHRCWRAQRQTQTSWWNVCKITCFSGLWAKSML